MNLADFSDEQLVIACRRGDAAAWEALVSRFQRLIYSIPRRAGLDDDAASDVFQEVFAALCQKIDSIDDPSRIHAWLVTTAKRITWRTIERSRSTSRVSIDRDDDSALEAIDIIDDELLPSEVIEKLELQHTVRAAVASLEDRCRKLITMLFYRNEPPQYSDIAAALGTSEGSIGPTRARCLKKLMDRLRHLGV